MALETLKDVEEIGGFKTFTTEQMTRDEMMTSKKFIWIEHTDNFIAFKIQDGPIKENGVNGCQVDTLISAAGLIIAKLNDKFPCQHNENAISSLKVALSFLNKRKLDREKRGVEGLTKE